MTGLDAGVLLINSEFSYRLQKHVKFGNIAKNSVLIVWYVMELY